MNDTLNSKDVNKEERKRNIGIPAVFYPIALGEIILWVFLGFLSIPNGLPPFLTHAPKAFWVYPIVVILVWLALGKKLWARR